MPTTAYRTAPAGVATDLVEDPFTGQLLEIEVGAAAPLYPPDEWFSLAAADAAPALPAGVEGGPMKLTVHPGGRVSGLIAPRGQCLIGGGGGECWMIPRPRDEAHEYFRAHGGWTKTASGALVATSVIGGGKGHASEYATTENAQAFYADTSTQLMRGVYRWSDVAGGLVFVGALWPEITERQVAGIMASPASIDYRWIREEGDYRLVGSCLVNIPGFPAKWKMAARRVASAMILTPILADGGEHSGTMLALNIDAPGLAQAGGLEPDEMHLTMGYFGKAPQYDEATRAAVVSAVEAALTAEGRPLVLEVNGAAVLGPPDEQVTVLLMQGEGLTELREVLLAACIEAGLAHDMTYPQWIPHVTLGPVDVVSVEDAAAFRGVTVAPASVIVGFGSDDWREFPLPEVGAPIMADSAGWRKWCEENPEKCGGERQERESRYSLTEKEKPFDEVAWKNRDKTPVDQIRRTQGVDEPIVPGRDGVERAGWKLMNEWNEADPEAFRTHGTPAKSWADYTQGNTAEINAACRSGKPSDSVREQIRGLDRAFEEHGFTVQSEVLVYRGMRSPAGMRGELKVPKVGDVVTNDAYTSTSASKLVAHKFMAEGVSAFPEVGSTDLLWRIRLPGGSRVLPGGLSHEQEFILPRAGRLRIIGVEGREVDAVWEGSAVTSDSIDRAGVAAALEPCEDCHVAVRADSAGWRAWCEANPEKCGGESAGKGAPAQEEKAGRDPEAGLTKPMIGDPSRSNPDDAYRSWLRWSGTTEMRYAAETALGVKHSAGAYGEATPGVLMALDGQLGDAAKTMEPARLERVLDGSQQVADRAAAMLDAVTHEGQRWDELHRGMNIDPNTKSGGAFLAMKPGDTFDHVLMATSPDYTRAEHFGTPSLKPAQIFDDEGEHKPSVGVTMRITGPADGDGFKPAVGWGTQKDEFAERYPKSTGGMGYGPAEVVTGGRFRVESVSGARDERTIHVSQVGAWDSSGEFIDYEALAEGKGAWERRVASAGPLVVPVPAEFGDLLDDRAMFGDLEPGDEGAVVACVDCHEPVLADSEGWRRWCEANPEKCGGSSGDRAPASPVERVLADHPDSAQRFKAMDRVAAEIQGRDWGTDTWTDTKRDPMEDRDFQAFARWEGSAEESAGEVDAGFPAAELAKQIDADFEPLQREFYGWLSPAERAVVPDEVRDQAVTDALVRRVGGEDWGGIVTGIAVRLDQGVPIRDAYTPSMAGMNQRPGAVRYSPWKDTSDAAVLLEAARSGVDRASAPVFRGQSFKGELRVGANVRIPLGSFSYSRTVADNFKGATDQYARDQGFTAAVFELPAGSGGVDAEKRGITVRREREFLASGNFRIADVATDPDGTARVRLEPHSATAAMVAGGWVMSGSLEADWEVRPALSWDEERRRALAVLEDDEEHVHDENCEGCGGAMRGSLEVHDHCEDCAACFRPITADSYSWCVWHEKVDPKGRDCESLAAGPSDKRPDEVKEADPMAGKPPDVVAQARLLAAEAQRIEPGITSMMEGIAASQGGELVGLQHRLKKESGLARKIEADMKAKGLTAEAAAAGVSDSVRYTVAFTPEKYAGATEATLETMRQAGFGVRVKNFWKPGDPYNGINVKMQDPSTGREIEVQFHTAASLVAKEETHKIYEDYRVLPKGDPGRAPMWERMVQIADSQTFPVGVDRIEPLLSQSPDD